MKLFMAVWIHIFLVNNLGISKNTALVPGKQIKQWLFLYDLCYVAEPKILVKECFLC